MVRLTKQCKGGPGLEKCRARIPFSLKGNLCSRCEKRKKDLMRTQKKMQVLSKREAAKRWIKCCIELIETLLKDGIGILRGTIEFIKNIKNDDIEIMISESLNDPKQSVMNFLKFYLENNAIEEEKKHALGFLIGAPIDGYVNHFVDKELTDFMDVSQLQIINYLNEESQQLQIAQDMSYVSISNNMQVENNQ